MMMETEDDNNADGGSFSQWMSMAFLTQNLSTTNCCNASETWVEMIPAPAAFLQSLSAVK